MKRNGFTLIELLVVVAIIGILAAVGTVAYNGYTLAAKINVVKANHESAVKYISNELMKCEIGQSEIFEGNLDCNDLSRENIIAAAVLVMRKNFRNPFHPNSDDLDYFTGISKNCDAAIGKKGIICFVAPKYQYDRINLAVCHPGIDPCYKGLGKGTALQTDIIID